MEKQTFERRLLSVGEVARVLDVSPRTIWQWRDSGRLPAPVRLGKLVKWDIDAIDAWVDDGCPDLSKRRVSR